MAGMGSFYVGLSGLQTSQNALNTTAHNLANVDTKGYTRQQVYFATRNSNTIGSSAVESSQVGLGVSLSEVRQVRDFFLDKYYRQEVGRQGFYEANYAAASEVETLFQELEGVAFQDSLTEFYKVIEELSKAPADTVNRGLFVQRASEFLSRSQGVAVGLREYQSNLNQKVSSTVDRINELGNTIFNLNKQIKKAEVGGVESANDLRDLRSSALDELASLIKIDVKEDAEGNMTIRAEGVPFLTRDYCYEIQKKVDPDNGFVTPVWGQLNTTPVFDLSNSISTDKNNDKGMLKGFMLARGTKEQTYTAIPTAPKEPVESDFETNAEYQAAMVQYNADLSQYQSDVKDYNTYINPSFMMNVQAEFDQLIHGITTAINDILCPNKTIQILDGGVLKEISVWDEENSGYGLDENKSPRTEVFVRSGYNRYQEAKTVDVITGVNPDGTFITEQQTVYEYNEEDPSDYNSLYSVNNMSVNKKLLQDSSYLPLSTVVGEEDLARAQKLVDAWNVKFASLNPGTTGPSTFFSYYEKMTGQIGIDGGIYQKMSEALAGEVATIENGRQQIVGVASDEELTLMVQYQSAYNASSRYINVISEMLEHIINTLGS